METAAILMAFLALATAVSFAENVSVSISSPQNGHVFTGGTADLSFAYSGAPGASVALCTVKVDSQSRRVTAISGSTAQASFGGLPPGNHTWSVECPGENGQPSAAAGYFSTYTEKEAETTVAIVSPENNAKLSANNITVAYEYHAGASSAHATCRIIINGILSSTNYDSSSIRREVSISGLKNGSNAILARCTPDGMQQEYSSQAVSIFIKPDVDYGWSVRLAMPEQNFNSRRSRSQNFTYEYFAGSGGPAKANCMFYFDGKAKSSFSDASGQRRTVTVGVGGIGGKPITPGEHSWQVICSSAGNKVQSESRSITFSQSGADVPEIIMVSPEFGQALGGTSVDFSIRYFSGKGPKNASCYLLVDDKVQAGFDAHDDGASPSGVAIGGLSASSHTWQAICENPGWKAPIYSQRRPFGLSADPSALPPEIVLVSPQAGADLTDAAKEFSFRYNANSGPQASACAVQIDGKPCDISLTVGGNQITSACEGDYSNGAHSWNVACSDSSSGAKLATSGIRAFSIGGMPAEEAASGLSTVGAGTSAKRRVYSQAAMLPGIGMSGGADSVLSVPADARTNQEIMLQLTSINGRPLPEVDILIRAIGSNATFSVKTDSIGRAAFIPSAAGIYSFDVLGHTLSEDAAIRVHDGGASGSPAIGGVSANDAIVWALGFAGFAALAGVIGTGAMLFVKKKTEDDE